MVWICFCNIDNSLNWVSNIQVVYLICAYMCVCVCVHVCVRVCVCVSKWGSRDKWSELDNCKVSARFWCSVQCFRCFLEWDSLLTLFQFAQLLNGNLPLADLLWVKIYINIATCCISLFCCKWVSGHLCMHSKIDSACMSGTCSKHKASIFKALKMECNPSSTYIYIYIYTCFNCVTWS